LVEIISGVETQQQQTGKCSAFDSSALLHIFFISNSAISVGGGVKIFFAPERKVP